MSREEDNVKQVKGGDRLLGLQPGCNSAMRGEVAEVKISITIKLQFDDLGCTYLPPGIPAAR